MGDIGSKNPDAAAQAAAAEKEYKKMIYRQLNIRTNEAEFLAQQGDDSSVELDSNDEDYRYDYLKVMGHVKVASEIAKGADHVADDDVFFKNFHHEPRKAKEKKFPPKTNKKQLSMKSKSRLRTRATTGFFDDEEEFEEEFLSDIVSELSSENKLTAAGSRFSASTSEDPEESDVDEVSEDSRATSSDGAEVVGEGDEDSDKDSEQNAGAAGLSRFNSGGRDSESSDEDDSVQDAVEGND